MGLGTDWRPTRCGGGIGEAANACISLSCSLARLVRLMLGAPGDLRKTEIQVPERTTDRDIGQAQVDAGAEGLSASPLAMALRLALILASWRSIQAWLRSACTAAVPGGLHARQHGGVE
jgi:hypothetical protein